MAELTPTPVCVYDWVAVVIPLTWPAVCFDCRPEPWVKQSTPRAANTCIDWPFFLFDAIALY